MNTDSMSLYELVLQADRTGTPLSQMGAPGALIAMLVGGLGPEDRSLVAPILCPTAPGLFLKVLNKERRGVLLTRLLLMNAVLDPQKTLACALVGAVWSCHEETGSDDVIKSLTGEGEDDIEDSFVPDFTTKAAVYKGLAIPANLLETAFEAQTDIVQAVTTPILDALDPILPGDQGTPGKGGLIQMLTSVGSKLLAGG